MKLNDLRKIIREEVTKVVRKELVGFVKLLGESSGDTTLPRKKKIGKKPKPSVTEKSLKDMMSEFEGDNFDAPKQNFSNNPVLNDILNETAQAPPKPGFESYQTMGDKVYDKQSMAEVLGYGEGSGTPQNIAPMSTPDGRPIAAEQVPEDVVKAMTRNYGDLMKAIDKKKQGSPLKG
jgi:hypothetical protein